jgi:hypothetical protein
MSKLKEEYSARLVIYKANEMSKNELSSVASWLRRQAKTLVKDGSNYSKRFIARRWS